MTPPREPFPLDAEARRLRAKGIDAHKKEPPCRRDATYVFTPGAGWDSLPTPRLMADEIRIDRLNGLQRKARNARTKEIAQEFSLGDGEGK